MRTVLISAAWTVATLVAIVAWRRLVPAPMPRIFDFILRTKFRRRTFSPEVAAERHGLAPGMRALELGLAGGYLTAAAARQLEPGGRLVCLDLVKTDEPSYPILSIDAQSPPPVVVWTGWVCGNTCGVYHYYEVAQVDGAWVIQKREDWIS
jgi:hypothetical protein